MKTAAKGLYVFELGDTWTRMKFSEKFLQIGNAVLAAPIYWLLFVSLFNCWMNLFLSIVVFVKLLLRTQVRFFYRWKKCSFTWYQICVLSITYSETNYRIPNIFSPTYWIFIRSIWRLPRKIHFVRICVPIIPWLVHVRRSCKIRQTSWCIHWWRPRNIWKCEFSSTIIT